MNLDLSVHGLRKASARAADLYTEIFARLEDRRVDPGVDREEMITRLAGTIGERGVGVDAVLEEFSETILPNSMGTPHPLYLGLVNSSPLPAGPLADLLVSSLNNNGGGFHQSPAMSATEHEVIRVFAELCGLGADASGMILPGGTLANLQALLLARQRHFPRWQEEGPAALGGNQPRLYRSEVTHFCNDRAAQVIGIGRRGLVHIPAQGRGAIDPQRLEEQVVSDRDAGHLPFAVVANAGTTGTGAVDDLGAVADICQRYGLWLHVDACYGGGALLLQPGLPELAGIGRADSIAIDPHKWFFVPMTAGMLLTRHRDIELATFDIEASYIPSEGPPEAYRRGLPTSRRSSGLTVWMALRAHGWSVIREAVERDIRLSRLLEHDLRDAGFRVLDGGQLSVACARWEPNGVQPSDLDPLQVQIAKAVIATGRSWFSTVTYQGETWLRFNVVNLHTREHHIHQLAELLTDTAVKLSKS